MFPVQQIGDWVMTRVGTETIVFNRNTSELHTLHAHHMAVWGACTGQNTPIGIAHASGLDLNVVEQCPGHLSAAGLLVASDNHGINRRKMVRTAAVVAGIISVSAPMAAMAESTAICIGTSFFCRNDGIGEPTVCCFNFEGITSGCCDAIYTGEPIEAGSCTSDCYDPD